RISLYTVSYFPLKAVRCEHLHDGGVSYLCDAAISAKLSASAAVAVEAADHEIAVGLHLLALAVYPGVSVLVAARPCHVTRKFRDALDPRSCPVAITVLLVREPAPLAVGTGDLHDLP